MSRVKSTGREQLRVVGFDKNHLIPAPKEVLNFLEEIHNVPAEEGCKCCQVKTPTAYHALPSLSAECTSADEEYCEEDLEEIDAAVASYLESATEVAESDTLQLADVTERMHATDSLHIVPSDFNYQEFLSSLTN